MKYSFLFPGCGIKFLGNEYRLLSDCTCGLDSLLQRAEKVCSVNVNLIKMCFDGSFTDELQSQFAVYLYSCAMSDLLSEAGIASSCCAGYSMGIYAAMYHAGAIDFEDGLRIIEAAYHILVKNVTEFTNEFHVVLGLSRNTVLDIIDRLGIKAEIINENNEISYVVSGHTDVMKRFTIEAESEGALRIVKLPLRVPYHTETAKKAHSEFINRLKDIRINAPRVSVISCVNQNAVNSVQDVADALGENLFSPLNWFLTVRKMLENRIADFIECGPGDSLAKNMKFIDGDFKINNMKNLREIINYHN